MDSRQLQYQRNCEILAKYLPELAVPLMARWIVEYDFKLRIRPERSTRLGDYTPPVNRENHLITVNHNLNKYAFLITLVHEVAHLVTFNEYRNRVQPHGVEWKRNFQKLMQPFLSTDIFPLEVFAALRAYMQNPAASSCTDDRLLRTLKLHDDENGTVFLERIPPGSEFLFQGNRVFVKGERLRKRFKCRELATGQVYLFNPLVEVELFREGFTGRSGAA